MDHISESRQFPNPATDLMRIIAAFFVIMIHSSGIGSPIAIILNSLSRFSVPVFVIISGYYMLDRNIGIRRLFQKSIHLFVIMLLWSGIYFIYDCLCGFYVFTDIPNLLTYLLTQPLHLWYIYASIALYLLTPILYVFCRNASRKEHLYALAVTFSFGSIIVIMLRSEQFPLVDTIINKMKIPYTMGFIFLYLLGNYFKKYDIIYKKTIYFIGILGTLATIMGTLILSTDEKLKELLFSFFAPNVLISGVAFFLFIQEFFQSHHVKRGAMLHQIAGYTLGIYLLHPLILQLFNLSSVRNELRSASDLWIIPETLIVFIITALFTALIKKIPLVRRLVC